MENPKKKTYELVVEQIEVYLLENRLQPGDRLPAERDLAALFGVSRTSVREALKVMEMNGAIEIRRGGGSFIAASEHAKLSRVLSSHFDDAETHFIHEMLELRRAFEVEAASLAAQRATPENLEAIQEALDRMKEAIDDPEAGVLADLEFHLLVARAAKNRLLIDMMGTLAKRMEDNIRATRRHRFVDASRHKDTYEEHQEIFLAIASGNAGLAARLMEKHISRIRLELNRSVIHQPKTKSGLE